MLAFALFCCIQRRKKKTQETEVIHFDEHKTVKETVVPGPFGREIVQITVEDDIHIDEEIKKNETFGHHHGLHAKSSSVEPDQAGNSSSLAVGTTSSGGQHHHQLDNEK
ncbi:pistil-specific extensin-like protein isoform X1 [Sesbania bispinosa]|nr:pistil-specific extensin-like protein isoform X1 [Sesbania bispinosa]